MEKKEMESPELRIEPGQSAVAVLDSILGYALERGASDIHIDPQAGGIAVRVRVDGLLFHCATLPLHLHQELVARIKILSRLRPDIHLLAQDGRFAWNRAEFRVSIVPTHFGENAVVRVLDGAGRFSDLSSLGFSAADEEKVKAALRRTQGMILVTGPTGSGKTSTMYAMLKRLASESLSIVTLEDPVEYAFGGNVRQVAVDHRHGMNFGNGLRSLVRQDPDVIMVGEIRDKDTAQIATNIALTGHLLISTLHTSDAVGAVTRLMDIGIDPYLIGHTLSVVVAQRLVRTLCGECWGDGCDGCFRSGYKGRTVVAEVLEVDEEIRAYISARLPADEIARHARAKGMSTMRDHAWEKVEWGVTTEAEARRVLEI